MHCFPSDDALPEFYITTPIFYVNDKPHIGHAYTMVMSDIIARWHALNGEKVFFLTGTDEHGEKIAKAASGAGKSPKEFVDGIVSQFEEMWKILEISNDDFIRTTEKRHENTVAEFIKRLKESGDIYKGAYEGWYCTPDETFFTALQLKEGKCPQCGREVKLVNEESYFFKLSKYREKLLNHYKENPEFLSPQFRSQEIINRVEAGLNDISITRTTVEWALPFPGDEKHTVYVWVDALINYLSAIGWPKGRFEELWPADVHVVGKEINWFHSVIWPAMLLSAGIAVPRRVFAHGWWTIEGRKMSKSFGNAINPKDITSKYGTDALRYFLAREIPFGEDGDFSEKALVARINGELVDDLGNLANRVLTLAEKSGVKIKGKPELEEQLHLPSIEKYMEKLDTFKALGEIWSFIRAANKYVNDKEAWKKKGDELSGILYNLLESLRIISILIYPFMPETSERLRRQLGVDREGIEYCKFGEFRGRPRKGEYLFKKVMPEKA